MTLTKVEKRVIERVLKKLKRDVNELELILAEDEIHTCPNDDCGGEMYIYSHAYSEMHKDYYKCQECGYKEV